MQEIIFKNWNKIYTQHTNFMLNFDTKILIWTYEKTPLSEFVRIFNLTVGKL